ncbi:MAG: hypothetical protein ABIR28_15130 [Vicinamibacteria bacterium]
MTEKEQNERRIGLNWTVEQSRATAQHGGVEYAVSVDLVGASGKKDWEWLVWVDGVAHFAPRLSERLAFDRDSGMTQGKSHAEGVAFNAQETRELRAAAGKS